MILQCKQEPSHKSTYATGVGQQNCDYHRYICHFPIGIQHSCIQSMDKYDRKTVMESAEQ